MTGVDHPLALTAVADHVGLQRVGAVVLLVAGHDPFDFLGRLEVGVGKDPGSGGKGAGANQVASVNQILIGEHVVSTRLWVAAGRDPVSEVGEEAPGLEIENGMAHASSAHGYR